MRHLDPNLSYLAVVREKITKGKTTVIQNDRDVGNKEMSQLGVQGIFFDGRKDDTKIIIIKIFIITFYNIFIGSGVP